MPKQELTYFDLENIKVIDRKFNDCVYIKNKNIIYYINNKNLKRIFKINKILNDNKTINIDNIKENDKYLKINLKEKIIYVNANVLLYLKIIILGSDMYFFSKNNIEIEEYTLNLIKIYFCDKLNLKFKKFKVKIFYL